MDKSAQVLLATGAVAWLAGAALSDFQEDGLTRLLLGSIGGVMGVLLVRKVLS